MHKDNVWTSILMEHRGEDGISHAFLNWILWKCGTNSPLELSKVLTNKHGAEKFLWPLAHQLCGVQRPWAEKDFPRVLCAKNLCWICTSNLERDLLWVPDLGAMPSFTTSLLCSSPFSFHALLYISTHERSLLFVPSQLLFSSHTCQH